MHLTIRCCRMGYKKFFFHENGILTPFWAPLGWSVNNNLGCWLRWDNVAKLVGRAIYFYTDVLLSVWQSDSTWNFSWNARLCIALPVDLMNNTYSLALQNPYNRVLIFHQWENQVVAPKFRAIFLKTVIYSYKISVKTGFLQKIFGKTGSFPFFRVKMRQKCGPSGYKVRMGWKIKGNKDGKWHKDHRMD